MRNPMSNLFAGVRARRQADVPVRRTGFRTVARRLALAGTGTVLLLGALTATADAAVVRKGYECEGAIGEESRCVWFNHDTTNHRVRGYAKIWDSSGWRKVDVTRVVLQVRDAGSWARYTSGTEKGWHETEDVARTGLVSCRQARTPTFRVVAQVRFSANRAGTSWYERQTVGPAATVRC